MASTANEVFNNNITNFSSLTIEKLNSAYKDKDNDKEALQQKVSNVLKLFNSVFIRSNESIKTDPETECKKLIQDYKASLENVLTDETLSMLVSALSAIYEVYIGTIKHENNGFYPRDADERKEFMSSKTKSENNGRKHDDNKLITFKEYIDRINEIKTILTDSTGDAPDSIYEGIITDAPYFLEKYGFLVSIVVVPDDTKREDISKVNLIGNLDEEKQSSFIKSALTHAVKRDLIDKDCLKNFKGVLEIAIPETIAVRSQAMHPTILKAIEGVNQEFEGCGFTDDDNKCKISCVTAISLVDEDTLNYIRDEFEIDDPDSFLCNHFEKIKESVLERVKEDKESKKSIIDDLDFVNSRLNDPGNIETNNSGNIEEDIRASNKLIDNLTKEANRVFPYDTLKCILALNDIQDLRKRLINYIREPGLDEAISDVREANELKDSDDPEETDYYIPAVVCVKHYEKKVFSVRAKSYEEAVEAFVSKLNDTRGDEDVVSVDSSFVVLDKDNKACETAKIIESEYSMEEPLILTQLDPTNCINIGLNEIDGEDKGVRFGFNEGNPDRNEVLKNRVYKMHRMIKNGLLGALKSLIKRQVDKNNDD